MNRLYVMAMSSFSCCIWCCSILFLFQSLHLFHIWLVLSVFFSHFSRLSLYWWLVVSFASTFNFRFYTRLQHSHTRTFTIPNHFVSMYLWLDVHGVCHTVKSYFIFIFFIHLLSKSDLKLTIYTWIQTQWLYWKRIRTTTKTTKNPT